jgi:4-hydroxybenzoate polyprenyltransferase
MLAWIRETAVRLGHLTRWSEWYDTKLPFVAIAYLLLVLTYSLEETSAEAVLRILAFSGFYLAFGYAYNDWADRESDRRAGKPNAVGELAWPRVALLLAGLVIGSLASIWSLLGQLDVLTTVVLSYPLALAYSAPPVRLKERGWTGLIVASIAQRCLPCWLLFVARGHISELSISYTTLIFIVGLRWMVTHQLADHTGDQASQTETYTTRVGYARAQRWLPRFLTLELALIAWLTVRMIGRHPAIVAITVLYVLVTALMTWTTGETLWQMLNHPSTAYLVLSDFYFLYWPLGLALVWIIHRPATGWWILGLAVWLRRHILQHLDDLHRLWNTVTDAGVLKRWRW